MSSREGSSASEDEKTGGEDEWGIEWQKGAQTERESKFKWEPTY